jgi:CheY-like chemotaxis protein
LLIALTGYGQKEDQMRAMEAGFDRHFVKPTDPRLLAQLIADWSVGSAPTGEPARHAESAPLSEAPSLPMNG